MLGNLFSQLWSLQPFLHSAAAVKELSEGAAQLGTAAKNIKAGFLSMGDEAALVLGIANCVISDDKMSDLEITAIINGWFKYLKDHDKERLIEKYRGIVTEAKNIDPEKGSAKVTYVFAKFGQPNEHEERTKLLELILTPPGWLIDLKNTKNKTLVQFKEGFEEFKVWVEEEFRDIKILGKTPAEVSVIVEANLDTQTTKLKKRLGL